MTTKQLFDFFVVPTRDDGGRYYNLTDDRPDWLAEAVQDAHDGEWPNDWRYEICADIIYRLQDDPDMEPYEIAGELVDIYNADLLGWVSEYMTRIGYVDEAAAENGLDGGIIGQISRGQYYCILQMAEILAQAILDNQEET